MAWRGKIKRGPVLPGKKKVIPEWGKRGKDRREKGASRLELGAGAG